MDTKIKNICGTIIKKCIEEFKNEENSKKIKKEILDPAIKYIIDKLYPYILATCVIFVLTFILAAAILMILIFSKKN